MPELPGIFTKLSLDTTGFQSGVSATQTALSGLGRASQSALGTLSSIGNSISSFVIGKGLSDLPAMMENAARAASNAETDQLRLKQAILNTGVSWESQAANIDATTAKARSMGFAMGDVRSSLSNLTAITGNADEAQKRLQLAMDLSRGTGLDLTTSSRLLGKVTDENVNVLARYGIHMEKGASSTELFAAIQQKYGGQAATFANSATGQMQQYQATMGQVTAQLGQAFLPILQLQAQFMMSYMVPIVTQMVVPALKQIADWSKAIGAVILTEFMPIWREAVKLLVGDVAGSAGAVGGSFKDIGTTIGAFVRPAVDVLRDSFKTIVQVFQGDWSPSPEINGITNAIGTAATFIRDTAYPAFMGLFGFISDNRQVIASVVAGFAAFAFLSTVAGWIAGVTAVVGPLVAGFAGIVAIIGGGGGLTAILGGLVAALGGPVTVAFLAIGLLTAAWVNDWGGIQEKTKAVLDFIGPYIQAGLAAISGFWTDHGGQILEIASLAWDAIKTYIGTVWALISGIVTAGMQLLSGDWSGAWDTIKTTASTVWDGIQTIVGDAFAALDLLTGGKLTTIKDGMGLIWQAIKLDIDAIWNAPGNIVATIGTAWDSIKTATDTALNAAGTGIVAVASAGWGLVKTGLDGVFGNGTGDTITGLVSAGWTVVSGVTKSLLSGDTGSAWAYAKAGFDLIKGSVDGIFGKETGDTITGILSAGWNGFKTLTETVFGAGQGARAVFEGAMNALKSAMDPVHELLGKISDAIGKLKDIMPSWLIPHSPTPFEIGLRGIADAANEMAGAFSGIGGGTDLLRKVGMLATSIGGGDFGRVSMAIMGAETNGGKNLSEIGGTGAKGPFQFDPGGELRNFASSLHVSLQEAAIIAVTKPMEAAAWALHGYLGQAIHQGMERGLSGRDLAVYAERVGQRPRAGLEERAGEWYDRLFKAAGGGMFTQPTLVLAGESGPEAIFNAQQMRWLGGALGGGNGRPIHVTVQLGSRVLADAWVEGRQAAGTGGRL